MCYKAIVLEVKEDYCIVMLDDSQIVRVKKKEGVREGQQIYVLEEDFYQKEESKNGAVIIPFKEGKKKNIIKKSFMTKIAAAAAAIVIFAGVATAPEFTDPIYATVSFDGDQSVQLELDNENRVLRAKSYDGTVEEKLLSKMKGKNLDELWSVLRSLSGEGESILVASAPMNKRAEKNEEILEQYIHEKLDNEEIICLRGDKQDVHDADDAEKSLGIYILEKAMSDDQLADYLCADSYKQGNIADFLERLKHKYPDAYDKLLDMDDDFDADIESETEVESESVSESDEDSEATSAESEDEASNEEEQEDPPETVE